MMWPEAATGMVSIALLGVIVAVVIIQLGSAWRARTSVAREEAYRKLAEDNLEVQLRTERRLDELAAGLAEVRTRTEELERMLREVDEPWVRERK
jgi:hypothetical protein